MRNFGQILPPFAARFAGVFADVEAPGDERETTKKCPWSSVLDP